MGNLVSRDSGFFCMKNPARGNMVRGIYKSFQKDGAGDGI